jgi:glycosyltransferase involved in cell wall biosynthesis
VVPGKGLEYLMDAYKQINTDLPLIIAGDSVFVDDFYQMIREKASHDNRVKLIGFVQGDVLRELYSNAKLFVFPSEAEGMPMCLLEALSYDCNCLVSDIPENLEVGKEYVHSFHTCDADDLRVKLKDCLKKEGRNNSREYIRKDYSWENVVEKTLACYKEK